MIWKEIRDNAPVKLSRQVPQKKITSPSPLPPLYPLLVPFLPLPLSFVSAHSTGSTPSFLAAFRFLAEFFNSPFLILILTL